MYSQDIITTNRMQTTTTSTKPLYRGIRIVWYALGIVEVLLSLRFVLKLLAANPNAGFTDLIYDFSQIFLAPFANVFRPEVVDGRILEWTTLLAMLVYWIIAEGIIKLLVMNRPVSRSEADHALRKEDIVE